MRTFEERKAEIFRRSEDRIIKRKRLQKQILTTCIPLFLLLIVCVATILPEIQTGGMDKLTGEGMESLEHVDEKVVLSAEIERIPTATKPQYYGKQQYLLSEDAGEIKQFYDLVESAFESSKGNKPEKPQVKPPADNGNINENDAILSGSGELLHNYKITFTTADGTKVVYTLNGYMLTKTNSNERIILTKSQRDKLLKTLEALTMPKEETE